MEFLYKLYSNNYFGIGLFIVITILAFSFLIILFFGKKDEKARNASKLDNLESDQIENLEMNQENSETLKADSLETISLSNEQPVIEEVQKQESENTEISRENAETEIVNPFVSTNVVLNSDLVSSESQEEKADADDNPFISQIFSLNNELDSKEEKETEYSTIDPFHVDIATLEPPVIEEKEENNIFSEGSSTVQPEAVKKPFMSTQFSSVYLNKEKEEQDVNPVSGIKEVAPVKPEFELPKTIDLPKLNKNTNNAVSDNIIHSASENKEDNLNNIFANLEEETYTIEK